MSLNYAIKLPVNLFSVFLVQIPLRKYFLLLFCATFFFFFFKSFFSNYKDILARYIQSNSTDVTAITYVFCFYTRIKNWLKKWISVDLHLMQEPSMPSSECPLWFRALLVASCHEDIKLFHFMSLLYTSPTWSNCTMAVLFLSVLLYKKYHHWIF